MGSRDQTLIARSTEVADLKVRLPATQEREADAEYESDGAKTRLQQPHSGQHSHQAALSHEQDDIAALGAGLVEYYNYLACRLERRKDQMFSGLSRKLVEEERQKKMNIYEDS